MSGWKRVNLTDVHDFQFFWAVLLRIALKNIMHTGTDSTGSPIVYKTLKLSVLIIDTK